MLTMKHKICSVATLEDCRIAATFFNGVIKQYALKPLFSEYPQLKVLETDNALFSSVQIDVGGCGISWNDELDLDAEEIWANGTEIGFDYSVDEKYALGHYLTVSREAENMTQADLAEKTGIHQGDISKIECGTANPSLNTLKRLARGMNRKLSITFTK